MLFKHVAILGGGFSGMLAAHVLCDYAERVTLIERDDLRNHAPRNGIPQALHLHVLMQRGQVLLEKLIPGLLSELRSQIDWALDTKWYGPFGSYPQYPSEIKTPTFSRLWLDRAIYQRTVILKNLVILQGKIQRLQQHAGRVDTVEWIDAADQQHILKADLIIDARGRSSSIRNNLIDLGYEVLAPHVVKTELGYASRIYQLTEQNKYSFKQIYLQVRPQKRNKGVVISPIEDQKIMLTALGLGADKPQRDEQDFQQFLSQLPEAELQDFLKTLKPISDTHLYRNLYNSHSRFGEMKHWPKGLMVLGDAVCILNPVYGQGMTLITKQMLLLKSTLSKLQSHDESGWEHRLQKKIDKQFSMPWTMATMEDQRGSINIKLPWHIRCMHRYLDKILLLATQRRSVHHTFIKIMHMMQSPLWLFHPAVMMRVIFFKFKKEKS